MKKPTRIKRCRSHSLPSAIVDGPDPYEYRKAQANGGEVDFIVIRYSFSDGSTSRVIMPIKLDPAPPGDAFTGTFTTELSTRTHTEKIEGQFFSGAGSGWLWRAK